MRLWLYEDFIELFELASQIGYEALKERIVERFKMFCKNVIGTVLFNLVTIEESEDYDFKDILAWILYINPANDLIGGDQ